MTLGEEPGLNGIFVGSAHSRASVEAMPEPIRSIIREMVERGEAALKEDMRGITTGVAVPGLFPLAKTGLSLRSMVEAVDRFMASLSDAQRATASFDVTGIEWRSWNNTHPNLMRHGLCLVDISDEQKEAALEIMRQALSAAGFENARNVMKINEFLAELTGSREEYGEWYYFLSFFGQPSETEPWGWQIDGHHLIINCFVLGDQLVLTPYFSGSEPCLVPSGKYAGASTFKEEEATGLALMKALSPTQRVRATIGDTLPFDVLAAAQADNLKLPYEGLGVGEMTAEQRELLLQVVAVYVGRIRPGHDAIRMVEVRAHLSETYFAWIGPCDDTSAFYYRIHSPVILIEFDHSAGIVYNNREPSRRHIHTVVRTPNGNDYGHSLLQQHYAKHDHSHPDSPHRLGRE